MKIPKNTELPGGPGFLLKVWLCTFILTFSAGQSATAYEYPIGIPAAWIEPDVTRPARPADWSSEVPGYYFVNNVTGTDSGRKWGTPTAPRKTIPNPLGPGTRCELAPGVYTGPNPTQLVGAGTAGEWVANTSGPAWLFGLDADNRTSFNNRIAIRGSYFCVEQINNKAGTFSYIQINTATNGVGWTADHILFRDSEIYGNNGTATTAVQLQSNISSPSNHVIVKGVHVHGFGPDTPASTDIDGVGIFVNNTSQNIWVLDSEVHDMSGTGIACGSAPAGPSNTSYIYFGRNHVYDTWAAGIATKTVDHMVISENTVHDIDWTSWSEAKCIGAQYSVESMWIINNHCYNGDLGIKVGSVSGPNNTKFYIMGNLIHDILARPEDPTPPGDSPYTGAIVLYGGYERVIVGNTIYNCTSGIGMPQLGNVPNNAVIENNLIANMKYASINIEQDAQFANIRNNLFYQDGGQARLSLKLRNYTPDSGNSLSYVSGLIEADPRFVNIGNTPENRNLAIQENSPARNKGLADVDLTLNVYDLYQNIFEKNIRSDRSRVARPQGPDWDIGAYEYSDGQRPGIQRPSGAKAIPE